jgi:hypothetical protein
MPVTKTEVFEVRSDLIKWIEDKPAKVRRQAKLVIFNLAVASREPAPAQASVAILLAAQVEQLRALVADTRWWRRG